MIRRGTEAEVYSGSSRASFLCYGTRNFEIRNCWPYTSRGRETPRYEPTQVEPTNKTRHVISQGKAPLLDRATTPTSQTVEQPCTCVLPTSHSLGGSNQERISFHPRTPFSTSPNTHRTALERQDRATGPSPSSYNEALLTDTFGVPVAPSSAACVSMAVATPSPRPESLYPSHAPSPAATTRDLISSGRKSSGHASIAAGNKNSWMLANLCRGRKGAREFQQEPETGEDTRSPGVVSSPRRAKRATNSTKQGKSDSGAFPSRTNSLENMYTTINRNKQDPACTITSDTPRCRYQDPKDMF